MACSWFWAIVIPISLVGVLTLPVLVAAEDFRDRYEARTYKDASGGVLPYRLLKPKNYDPASKDRFPLVVFYHGAGERGDDNAKQLVHGLRDFASDPIMEKYPCFVVAPQCPNNAQWVDTPWSADSHTMPENPTAPLRQSCELVEALQKEFSIDPARLYVTGLSMGGYGVWDVIQRRPRQFAAAVPICGGGDANLAKLIAQVPVWAFHGGKDGAVKPKRSRDMIEALKAAGGAPRYTEYPDAGHDSWTATYRNSELYAWLFAQRKNN